MRVPSSGSGEAGSDASPERRGGLYSLLYAPWAYDLWKTAIRDPALRKRWLRESVKPFPGASILDIGCGTGRLLELLPPDAEYAGFDVNPRYIEAAERRYGGRGEFRCADAADRAVFGRARFDIAIANGILHHVDDRTALALLETARASLKPSGRLVTLDGVYAQGQSALARWIVSLDRGRHVRTSEAYLSLARRRFRNVEARILHDALLIPYTVIVMECSEPRPS